MNTKITTAIATMKSHTNKWAKENGEGQPYPYTMFEEGFFDMLRAKNLYGKFDDMVRTELGVSDTKCYEDCFYVWYEESCISDKKIDKAIETAFNKGCANLGEFMQLKYENCIRDFTDVEVILCTSNDDYHINLWDLAQGDANLFLKGVAEELRYAIRDIIMN